MDTFKPIFSSRSRAALWVTACLVGSLTAGEPAGRAPVRAAGSEEAQELLRKGDQAYQAERYAQAMEAYAGAREMMPDSAELRAATTERYAQAAVAQARVLSRNGDVAGAKATVDKVLTPDVAPRDPAARALRAQLDDPIRTNPALTAEHAKNVDAVRRLLYTAEGAYHLGKLDESKKHYQAVLRLDPTNTAARRGMEQLTAAKRGYHNAAYDQTRADMLGQVAASWELQVPAPELGAGPADPGSTFGGLGKVTVAAKLDRIIIPKIALEQASLEDALDLLRVKAAEGDTQETDPARKGVNFTVNLGPPDSDVAKRIRDIRFNLRLSQVPLSGVLKYLAENTHTSFTTDEFSVLISAAGATSDDLISRSFRVPPDFISNLNNGSGSSDAKQEDPFAAAPAKQGLITTRLSAQDAFTKQGVAFPTGASANYNAASNTLRVINTPANLDVIAQIVDAMTQTEPVMVSVRVTMIKTQQTNLTELGFDWLVTPLALNSANEVFGSGGTVGNTGGRTAADFVSPVDGTTIAGVPTNPTAKVNPGVATNGLRSGDQAINSASIDEMLSNTNRTAQQKSVAPGIMAVTGLFSGNQVQMVMRGLNQKKAVDIMAQPSIVTRSGQASKIELVREFIYPTEYEPPQIPQTTELSGPTPVTPATPTAFEKKDVGITLEVLPVADANKRFIDITLNPSFSDFDGFVNYGSPINTTADSLLGTQTVELTPNQILMPIFNVQKLATQLTVADGATIAIGGLMRESVQNVQDRVPLFGSIPVLGRLFQSTAKQPVTTAIIFLVHIELLDPTGRPYRDR